MVNSRDGTYCGVREISHGVSERVLVPSALSIANADEFSGRPAKAYVEGGRFSSSPGLFITCPLRLLSFKNSLAIPAVPSEEALSTTINSSMHIEYVPRAMFDSFCSITLASLYVGIIMLTVGCVFGWSAR